MKPLKWIEVDLSAIAFNARWVRSRLSPGVKLMAVVKADGYGHGAVPVAKTALKAGAESLGVLTIEEAAALRAAGIKTPIQLLAPHLPEQAKDAARLKLVPTVDSLAQARALNAAAPAAGLAVHVDLDFGLGRWGVAPRVLPAFLRALKRLKRLRLAGLSAHIDYVPGKNSVEAEEKLSAFHGIAQDLKRENPRLVAHAANSAVLMDFPHWHMDQVRAGNLLYGIKRVTYKNAPLKMPWSFHARIISLQKVPRGQSIGYASEYIAPRNMTVATLPVGYSDGLTMEPAGRGITLSAGTEYWGKLRGVKAPFVGRCGISHVLVDVTAAPGTRLGETVALPIRRTAASAHLPSVYK